MLRRQKNYLGTMWWAFRGGPDVWALRDWSVNRRFAMPAPREVKWSVLKRYAPDQCVWIETGTWKGDTTEFLSTIGRHVYSIEPDQELYQAAATRFQDSSQVSLIHGTSEEVLDSVLRSTNGNVALWLDGHFSGPGTHEGAAQTPIHVELATIAGLLQRFESLTIFIDDVRCFHPSVEGWEDYPELHTVLSWAKDHGFFYTIEHDIMVLTPSAQDLAAPPDWSQT